MIKYSIMAFMFGFTGNKLFGKDKTNEKSIKIASMTAIILITINSIILLI